MSGKNGAIKLVAGNSNPALAKGIANYLKLPLTKAVVRRFADMEIFVEIQENVRGADVFVIQSTSFPANDHLMELLIIIDALRRSSARRITAVIPYFGYARQARRQPYHSCRCRPRHDARPARRSDPGIFRYPDR
jgi:ribose-phosphate pyrophosphokinase